MKPLGLNVEQEVRADRYPFHFFNIVRQYLLIAAFNFSKAPERLRIVLEPLHFLQLVQMGDPSGADSFRNEPGQRRIALQQPFPLGDAVGLILEFLRRQLIPFLQHGFFQNFRVDLGHTVHRVRAVYGHPGHMHQTAVHNQIRRLGLAGNPLLLQRFQQRPLEHHHIAVHLRDHRTEQLHAPLLQGLRHDRVVGIGEGLPDNRERLPKGHSFFLHENPQQLRDRYHRMGIVKLDRVLL